MATKLPLVLGADGLAQQLQPGDGLVAAITTSSTRAMINGEVVAVPFGTPVYTNAAGSFKRAQANAKATSKVVGLAFDATIANGASGTIGLDGTIVGTVAQWDAVAGTAGGLVFNTTYFLDPATAGKITATPPTAVGQCNVVVGIAISATELELQIEQPILL
jgi:hypothetical protein